MLYVTLMDGRTTEETVLLKTEDESAAIKRAREEQSYIERDKRKGDSVEIRQYVEDIEDEDCDCFDYNTIEF